MEQTNKHNTCLIISYFITSPLIDDRATVVYEKIYPYNAVGIATHNDPRNKILSSHEARKIIREEVLTLVADNRYGKIWKKI